MKYKIALSRAVYHSTIVVIEADTRDAALKSARQGVDAMNAGMNVQTSDGPIEWTENKRPVDVIGAIDG